MQLGVMTNPHHSLTKEIEWAKANGFDYVDLLLEAPSAALESTDWKAVATAVQDAELGIVCQAASYLPLANPSPLVRQAALDELRRSIDAAALLSAPLLTVPFAGWPTYFLEKTGYEFSEQMLAILINHGKERGIQICLENSPRNQHQLKHFREIFHRLPELQLTYDIGNGNVGTAAQHTSRDYLFAMAGQLAHVHLSDNDGREPAYLPPGTPKHGGIDLPRDLQTLKSFGYDGRITLELFGEKHWTLATAAFVQELWGTEEKS